MFQPQKTNRMTGRENDMSDSNEPDNPGVLNTPVDLKSIESALAALQPRGDRLDRETLIFLAGRALAEGATAHPVGPVDESSVVRPRSAAFWKRSFAGMSAVAASLLVMLVMQTRGGRPVGSPTNHPAPTEIVRSEPVDGRASRTPRPNVLTSAPFDLQQGDAWLAAASSEHNFSSSTAAGGADNEPAEFRSSAPKSMLMLLEETVGSI